MRVMRALKKTGSGIPVEALVDDAWGRSSEAPGVSLAHMRAEVGW